MFNRNTVIANVIPCLSYKVEGKNVVKSRWLDLDLFFRVPFDESRYVIVTKEVLSMFDLTQKEIAQHAMDNIRRKCVVQSLEDQLRQMGAEFPFASGLIIMTTDDCMFGAGTMLLADKLAEIALHCGAKTLSIIPSSIHEVLVIPDFGDEEEINSIIREVNESCVSENERLSDHVYKYTVGDTSVRVQ